MSKLLVCLPPRYFIQNEVRVALFQCLKCQIDALIALTNVAPIQLMVSYIKGTVKTGTLQIM